MGFLPNLKKPEPGDFSQAFAKIDARAIELGVDPAENKVKAVKRLVENIYEFQKGFILIMEGDDTAGDASLKAASEKMGKLDPAHDDIDRLMISTMIAGLAAQISPENLAKGIGYEFL